MLLKYGLKCCQIIYGLNVKARTPSALTFLTHFQTGHCDDEKPFNFSARASHQLFTVTCLKFKVPHINVPSTYTFP